jgi:excisionase family DNA binding protein
LADRPIRQIVVGVQTTSERLTLTMDEAGQLLGVSGRTIRRLVRAGEIAAIRTASSGRVLIARAEVERFVERGGAQ